jgi:hypothetical protein
MTSLTGIRAGGALTLLLLAPSFAPAAWDNVFQVTCCKHKRVAAYASPCCPAPCPPPCPPPCPTYVQRSYYQPVTCYQAYSYCEPVTTYKTSYYYEPVCSYTYSCYVDPCTGCPQQVATPTTSYRVRTQCNAVQSYVQRVGYKPVTTYRQSFYWEQVPACPTCPATGPVVAAPPPAVGGNPPLNLSPEPALNESRPLPQPGLGESREQYYMPPANPSRLRTAPIAAPLKLDRMASLNAPVTGQIVTANYSPRAGAQVVFVNASRQDVRQATTADAAGHYQANLPAGEWYVYVDQTYHNRIDVKASEPRQITIVSR